MMKLRDWPHLAALALLALTPAAGCDREGVQASATSRAPEARSTDRSDSYSVAVVDEALDAESPSAVRMRIEPGDGLKINREFPWALTLRDPEAEGWALAKTTFEHGDFELEDKRALLEIPVKSARPGEVELHGVADFSVCNPEKCETLVEEPITLSVRATGSSAPSTPEAPAAPGPDEAGKEAQPERPAGAREDDQLM
jgi:hypothetical protein